MVAFWFLMVMTQQENSHGSAMTRRELLFSGTLLLLATIWHSHKIIFLLSFYVTKNYTFCSFFSYCITWHVEWYWNLLSRLQSICWHDRLCVEEVHVNNFPFVNLIMLFNVSYFWQIFIHSNIAVENKSMCINREETY